MNNLINKTIAWLRQDLWRTAFAAVAAALLFAMPVLSADAGTSGDEHLHYEQSQYVLSFYQTFGKDSSAVIPKGKDGNLREYGIIADNIASLAARALHSGDPMLVRHVCNSLWGWAGIMFAAMFAFRASRKWYAALITALLLFLSPRYLGHSFNNLKDIPFAAAMMMGTYYIFRFLAAMPRPPLRLCLMLALSIGLAIGTRVGGLLLIAYFGLFTAVWAVAFYANGTKDCKQPQQRQQALYKMLRRLFAYGAIISVSGYIFAVLVWPYALIKPVGNVMAAFEQMSHFKQQLRQVFEGKMQWSNELPWYYLPKYIAMSVPAAALLGAALYLFMGGLQKQRLFSTFIVYFAALFPLFWIIYSDANVYGGWRHALFVYPPLAAAAGMGFTALMETAAKKPLRILYALLPAALLLPSALFMLRNHPYEVVYFNRLAGGVKGASGNYEMDYYYHTTRRAAEWVRKDANESGMLDTIGRKVVVAAFGPGVSYYLRNDTARFNVTFVRWGQRGWSDWDYAIFTITGIPPELIRNKKAFPPKNTAYTIKADGTPICIVLKRTDRSDLEGHRAKQNKDPQRALPLLKQAYRADPHNEQALEDLVELYRDANVIDTALSLANYWADFNKGNTTALYHVAALSLMQGKTSDAILTAMRINKCNSRDISGLYVMAHAYRSQGKLNEAVRCLQRALDIRPDYNPAWVLYADLLDEAGQHADAQRIRQQIK